jgi:hypothetical protein
MSGMTNDLTSSAPMIDTAPRDRECLTCYLRRMLANLGCNSLLRWTLCWRDSNAPRATELRRQLMDRGGFCDCEVLLTVFGWAMPDHADDPLQPCPGVLRRGSTNPHRPRYPRPNR